MDDQRSPQRTQQIAPGRSGGNGEAGDRRAPLGQGNFPIRLVTVLALMNLIVAFCFTLGTLKVVEVVSAAAGARAQITAIQNLAKTGNITNMAHLKEMQTRLVSLNSDLVRLQSAIPPPASDTSVGSSLNHTLTMARELVQAGHDGVDAALILVPHLKGALKDVGASGSATAAATATTSPSPTPTPAEAAGSTNSVAGALTMGDVKRAQQDISAAGVHAQQALAERRYINEGQLSSIGLGGAVSILHKIDSFAPELPTYLGYANNIMAALPDLMGITKPAHFLLFDMDSDEMRSTGGFMGTFALLTVQGGRLIGGVHLKDTATFDCNGPPINCPYSHIPSQFDWMNADPTQFGMRDANLSPDFPTSAKLIIGRYQQEMRKYHPKADARVDGVIMITPEIIKDILKLTGPLTVPGFNQVVNASNLQDVIHFYHIQNRNSVAGGTKDQKAIDGLLGSALLHKVASFSDARQSALMKDILEAFRTKDVQVYVNDPGVESVLSGLHVDSAVSMPPGTDGLMVTDVNVGATYFSRDMRETVTDTITFDDQGDAIHDMTITYYLPKIERLYTPIYIGKIGKHVFPITYYTGVLRVLVPNDSMAIGGTRLPDGTMSAVQVQKCTITAFIPGCVAARAGEPGYVVWAARINSMQVGTDMVIFHLKWTSPNALQHVHGAMQYKLQLYRQAGSHISYDITITPQAQHRIAQPLSAPLNTPIGMTPGAAAEFTSASLAKDTTLIVMFGGS